MLIGNKYFLLIIDNYSRFMWVEMLCMKDQAFKFFCKIKALAENESGLRMKVFHTDHGGKFNSVEFADWCDEHAVKQCTTTPYSPQWNEVVEHRNKTIIKMAHELLKTMALLVRFWAKAIKTAKLGSGITKLSGRSTLGVFIGYEDGAKAYRVYDLEDKTWEWGAPASQQGYGGHEASPSNMLLNKGTSAFQSDEPISVDQALKEPSWRHVMEEGMKAIVNNETWDPAVLSVGHHAIVLKWVFKVKRDVHGNVVRHKAC
ncbi:uncharacterized protein LOC133930261 [Phragmites australis]|uniref:uncharacterized protein LOC133930261 n=1 Tax=Phragmites australis TaxID=29695 RepID=UPI002D765BD5|nr:uncharacterized protein LOC133930261 [Phragmites australis]